MAAQARDEGVHVFFGWGSVDGVLEHGGTVGAQFAQADYCTDFEVLLDDDLRPRIHMERTFATQLEARSWFAYLAWLVATSSPATFRAAAALCEGAYT
jgi:hypothetical protein